MDSTLTRSPTHLPRDALVADIVPNHKQDMTGSLMSHEFVPFFAPQPYFSFLSLCRRRSVESSSSCELCSKIYGILSHFPREKVPHIIRRPRRLEGVLLLS